MTRQNVEERCRRISAGYNENSVCRFADNGSLLGFIDTSQGQNGTRGIAFSDDRALMNFDGEPIEIFYGRIRNVQIISSFEDFFADELSITYADGYSDKEIRISDFSLDKSELKRLLDAFCGKDTAERPAKVTAKPDVPQKVGAVPTKGIVLPQNVGNLPQNGVIPHQNVGNPPQNAEIRKNVYSTSDKQFPHETVQPQRQTSADYGSGVRAAESPSNKNVSENRADRRAFSDNHRVNNISNAAVTERQTNVTTDRDAEIPPVFQHHEDFVDIVFEDRAPVITETVLPQTSGTRTPVIERQQPEQAAAFSRNSDAYNINMPNQAAYPNDDEDETAERIRIQNMSPEETLSFLKQSLSEINSPMPEPTPQTRPPEMITRPESAPPAQTQNKPAASGISAKTPQINAGQNNSAAKEEAKPEPLTVEPIWGDIYIKASRNLRELCESGRLSMKQIETELNDKLLDSAKAFAEITADESKVPKVLIPKITELKEAARNFDQYFQSGEDIAVRAMFFMLYQMLSYADRIVETPETKERLNDFFRRFGPAGITLSMLDMRV